MSLLSQSIPSADFYQYDPEKRKLAKPYRNAKILGDLVSDPILQVIFCVAFLLSGLSSYVWRAVSSLGLNEYASTGLYALVFIVLLLLVQLYPAWYDSYAVEHRFGLSRQTIGQWSIDYGKIALLAVAVMVPLTVGLYALIPLTPVWWLWASLIYAGLEIVGSVILPFVVVPLFYKLKPYADETQRTTLLSMARRAGAKNITRVMLADESARSAKANAFFAGVGGARTMVLFDNLVSSFTPREVVTVVAHELAHYVNKDVWRGAAVSALLGIPQLYLANEMLKQTTGRFGILGIWDPTGFPLILAILAVTDFLLQPVSNGISRMMEKQADEFALRVANEPDAQASTERRLADVNLADDRPHWLVELFFYTHPPPSKRIKLTEEWKRRKAASQS